MSALSRLLVLAGFLSLFHAYVTRPAIEDLARAVDLPTAANANWVCDSAYSAYEHSSVAIKLHSSSSLPLDITVETLVSLLLICFGLVLGSEPLKPLSWSTWAGNIEKQGGGSNPFRTLEDRVNFMDIRNKRKEFADWVRQGSSVDVKN